MLFSGARAQRSLTRFAVIPCRLCSWLKPLASCNFFALVEPQSTCAMRYNVTPGHMSSRSWATAIRKGGILDDSQEKNPAFSGANKASRW